VPLADLIRFDPFGMHPAFKGNQSSTLGQHGTDGGSHGLLDLPEVLVLVEGTALDKLLMKSQQCFVVDAGRFALTTATEILPTD
jgi:hypothetical protein